MKSTRKPSSSIQTKTGMFRTFGLSFLLFAFLVLSLSLTGCGGGGGGGGGGVAVVGGTLKGKIIASATSSVASAVRLPSAQVISGTTGIPNAEVWLAGNPGKITYTDKDGVFVLSEVPFGIEQRVICRYRDPVSGVLYLHQSVPVTISAQNPIQEVGNLPVAQGKHALRLLVDDPEGKAVPNAQVTLWGIPFVKQSDGSFLSPVLPEDIGSEELTISAAGFTTRKARYPFFASSVSPLYRITLALAGEINIPPTIYIAGMNTDVAPLAEVVLKAVWEDPDELSLLQLKPAWEATGGTLKENGSADSITWVVPELPGLATVSVSIRDTRNVKASANMAFVVGGLNKDVMRVQSFSPKAGAPGSTVVITGSGFGSDPAKGSVSFNGVKGEILGWTGEQINVKVPANVTSGLLVVKVSDQERSAGTFTVSDPDLALTPDYGPPQTEFSITGSGFGTQQGTSTIQVNGINATVTGWADTEVKAKAPVNAVSGLVVLNLRGRERVAGFFTVSRVFSLSPARATIGTVVTITGEGFGATPSPVRLSNGVSVTPSTWNSAQIIFKVSGNAVSGAAVTAIRGLDLNLGTVNVSAMFSVTPTIGLRGDNIVIVGTGFGVTQATSTVSFNGVNAPVGVWSDARLEALIPVTATTGSLTVKINGLELNSTRFQVLYLDKLNYERAAAGGVVTLTGSGFGTSVGRVMFGAVEGTEYASWGDDKVEAIVPADATGTVDVKVQASGYTSNVKSLKIAFVKEVDFLEGWIGREIIFTGANFGTTASGNQVLFTNLVAPISSWTETKIVAQVPKSAASGSLYLKMSGYNMDQGEFEIRTVTKFAQVGESWSGPKAKSNPFVAGVVQDRQGDIYLSDYDNGWIWKFKSDGTFIKKVGESGGGYQEFYQPRSLGIDASDNIYVADSGNHRIQVLDKDLNFQGWYGFDNTTATFHSSSTNASGTADGGLGRFRNPSGVFVATATGKIYVADTGNHRVQVFTSAWALDTTVSGDGIIEKAGQAAGTNDAEFNEPRGICVDSAGKIYVADSKNHRIQEFTAAGVFARWYGRENVVAATVGWYNPGNIQSKADSINGAFNEPFDVKLDGTGNMLVTDTKNGRVQVVSVAAGGAHVRNIGQAGGGQGQFSGIWSLWATTTSVFVGDTYNFRAQKMKLTGEYEATIAPDTTKLTSTPMRLAADSARQILYVVDEGDSSIRKFSFAGAYLGGFGNEGSGDGQFYQPHGIALDGSGNTYVVDGNSRVSKFSPDGVFLKKWGSFGSGTGQFKDPVAIAVTSSGNTVFVADAGSHRVLKFDGSGTYLGDLGTAGPGGADGQYNEPNALAIDDANNVIYVADTLNHRVQKFKLDGTFLGWWGKDTLAYTGWHGPASARTPDKGSGDGDFNQPIDVAVDQEGAVYVISYVTHDVQKFASDQTPVNSKGGYMGRIPTSNSGYGYEAVAVDALGYVYTVFRESNKIEKYEPDIY